MTRPLHEIQTEIWEWYCRNLRSRSRRTRKASEEIQQVLGAVEEIGELAHAHLKAMQGIRGTQQEMDLKAMDAVGDSMIFLLNYCSVRGWDASTVLEQTWQKVRRRDWNRDPRSGGEA